MDSIYASFSISLSTDYRLSPGEIPRQPSQEYFSSSSRKGLLLIPVDIWGGVVKPGRYFLPLGSNLQDAIGAAGGPTLIQSFLVLPLQDWVSRKL